jgi:integrase
MLKRRGHGEGSVSARADGRWQVRVDLGRGANGRRRRKYAYAETQGAAVKLLKQMGGRSVAGQLLTTTTPTVAAFLEDWFAMNSDEWRASTQRGYRGNIDRFLVPAFGTLRLEQLTPAVVQRWLLEHKREHGARRRIAFAHATLRSALAEAQRLQLVTINAAGLVRVPTPKARRITPLTVLQATKFLEVAGQHRLGALFGVALACGLRLGEATGLRWEDVDLPTGEVRVRQQLQRVGKRLVAQELKTEKSRRTLMLPAVCLDALRAHRTKQLEERLKAGEDWIDTGLVFTTFARRGMGRKVGAGLQPRNVLRTLYTLLDRAQLPRVRFHDLRHSAASLLIAAGVELVEVSMLLGHSELRVTADLYSHLQQQTAARAARHMDAMLTPRANTNG